MGLPGELATVDVDVESYAEEVRGDYIEQIRDALARAFTGVWATLVTVRTDEEVKRGD